MRNFRLDDESGHQEALFEWAAYHMDCMPELEYMHHIPNGGKRDKRTAVALKRQGVKAGVPDICLPVARNGYHGLYIELKAGKNKATKSQEKWQKFLNSQGYYAVICYGWHEAAKVIEEYLLKADNDKAAAVLQEMYHWIKDCLDINYPDSPISSYSYMASMENVEEICKMIAAFGTGITDYKLVTVPVDRVMSRLPKERRELLLAQIEKIMNEAKKETGDESVVGIIMRSKRDFFILNIKEDDIECQTIRFEHNNNDVLFDLSEESDGTVRILDLLEILLSDEGKTYVIDELDRCLHPSLTYKYIQTFLQLAAKKNIQLIVTTHESRLLDFDLLRRDEIWFVNKRKTGESDIYSLEEYNTRFDQKIDKAYLEGRYGGVPVFNTIFPVGED